MSASSSQDAPSQEAPGQIAPDQAAQSQSAALAAAAFRLLAEDARFKVGEAEIRGNTYRVFENAPASLVDVFRIGAGHGDRDFLYFGDDAWTFEGLWREARQFADGLKKTCGVGKGDRVAIAMRNFPEWCAAYMGVISLGAVVAPLNAWWKTEELVYAIKDSGARVVIVDAKRLDYLKPAREELGLTLVLAHEDGDGADHHYRDILASGAPEDPAADIDPDDDFCILYTSGSTGHPKGVILTHRGVVTALMSWSFLASVSKEAGNASIFGGNPGILLAVPLFHVSGSHTVFLLSYLAGRRLAMLYRWDPKEAVATIDRHQLTNFFGVPSQSYELMHAAGKDGAKSLIDINAGGAKRPPEHVKQLNDRFEGARPSAGYGLTETNALGTVAALDDYLARPDSAGRPVPPVTDIRVVGEDGAPRPDGEVGEICIRSPANFRGYLNLPEETDKALTPDGWFRTGDLGKLDADGFVYIVDRIKDLIIRGGENISCLEVEARAYEHEAVAEASVFSVPDEVMGERVGLVVYARPDAEIDASTLRAFIADRLAGFKVPEYIWVSPMALPRLATAKFDKRTIRQAALHMSPAWSYTT